MPMTGQPPHYHGVCCGGPFNAKHLSHVGETTFILAVNRDNPKQALPAQQGSTVARPCKFGDYLFDETSQTWVWDESSLRDTRIAVEKPAT
jgi:hypothetical protein